jgi:hypothetical protein
MEVWHGQQLTTTLFQPGFYISAVTLGAVAIAAGVIGVPLVATAVTLVEVTSELIGATGDQGPDDASMTLGHGGSVGIQIILAVSAQNVGDLQHRTWRPFRGDRSVH